MSRTPLGGFADRYLTVRTLMHGCQRETRTLNFQINSLAPLPLGTPGNAGALHSPGDHLLPLNHLAQPVVSYGWEDWRRVEESNP